MEVFWRLGKPPQTTDLSWAHNSIIPNSRWLFKQICTLYVLISSEKYDLIKSFTPTNCTKYTCEVDCRLKICNFKNENRAKNQQTRKESMQSLTSFNDTIIFMNSTPPYRPNNDVKIVSSVIWQFMRKLKLSERVMVRSYNILQMTKNNYRDSMFRCPLFIHSHRASSVWPVKTTDLRISRTHNSLCPSQTCEPNICFAGNLLRFRSLKSVSSWGRRILCPSIEPSRTAWKVWKLTGSDLKRTKWRINALERDFLSFYSFRHRPVPRIRRAHLSRHFQLNFLYSAMLFI